MSDYDEPIDVEECDECHEQFAADDLNQVELNDGHRSRVLLCEDCIERVDLAPPEREPGRPRSPAPAQGEKE